MTNGLERWIPHTSPVLGPLERQRVLAVLDSDFIGFGAVGAELQRVFSERTGRKFAFAVQSGFHALSLSLRALDLGMGATVALPVLTCSSILEAIVGSGYLPEVVDINRHDLTMNIGSLRERVQALVMPHAYGAPADITAASRLGVPWIEDCATSPGTLVCGKPAGSWGTIAIFSFGSTKYLAGGMGGMILLDAAALARRIRDLLDLEHRDLSLWSHPVPAALPGGLSDVNAALVLAQLEQLEKFRGHRMEIADYYRTQLQPMADCISAPGNSAGHSYFRYICRTKCDSDEVIKLMRGMGVDARASVNPWLDEACAKRGFSVGRHFSGANWWKGHLLSLPIHARMSILDAEFVTSAAIRAIRTVCNTSHVPASKA